jgi:hypothetical protein
MGWEIRYLLLWHEDALKSGIVQVCVTHMVYADKFNCMRNTPSAMDMETYKELTFPLHRPYHSNGFILHTFSDSKLSYQHFRMALVRGLV